MTADNEAAGRVSLRPTVSIFFAASGCGEASDKSKEGIPKCPISEQGSGAEVGPCLACATFLEDGR